MIYPIDVAKTVYQKCLLSAGSGHAQRPDIRFFQVGSYRGRLSNIIRVPFTSNVTNLVSTGLGVSVLRSCIINMIFFSNFELVKKHINALEV